MHVTKMAILLVIFFGLAILWSLMAGDITLNGLWLTVIFCAMVLLLGNVAESERVRERFDAIEKALKELR